MRRKIEEKLKFWFDNRKQALLITGARQIGKTYIINKFIHDKFTHIIHIDFSEQPEFIDTFAMLKNSNDLKLRLSAIAGDKMVPHKTVIFLDEIQKVYQRRDELKENGTISTITQDIITAMKLMVEQGEYRFILSGSLLGVAIKDVVLNPTGYLDEYKMYPMDFEEFLWAKGVGQIAIDHVKKCFQERIPVDAGVHQLFLDYFREYVLIGGMPEAVEAYIKSNNLFLVQNSYTQILNRYRQDITTYVKDDGLKLRIRNVFDSIPSQLSKKNMRYISSQVLNKQYLKNNNLEEEFLWLVASGVAIPTYHVNEPVIPLVLSLERKTMKLFSGDVGLLVSQFVDTGIREKLLNDEKEVNYGAPYENVAAQELIAHGFGDELFYYNSKKHGEVDFLVMLNNEVLPIEIKSGKSKESQIYNHGALNNLIKNYNYPIAYVFGETNVIKENDVVYQLPIYMIEFLRKE